MSMASYALNPQFLQVLLDNEYPIYFENSDGLPAFFLSTFYKMDVAFERVLGEFL